MKKYIVNSLILLLIMFICGCDENEDCTKIRVYEFWVELVDEEGYPIIQSSEEMKELADKVELKWIHPESSKYVEYKYFGVSWGMEKNGHYYWRISREDVIGFEGSGATTFNFDFVCEELLSKPVSIRTEWATSLPFRNIYYELDKIYVNGEEAQVTEIENGTITIPFEETIYIPAIQIKVDKKVE